ncbi:MAG: class I SAM-dependent methyltransferase [Clostridia bacterium]|nr:class I SAM-dependent methyltransferase [Clostridia bacterium]
MKFYDEISKYYDEIFPVGRHQLEFIRQLAGSPASKILDVACGTGGYSTELAKLGHTLTAVDVDIKMIQSLSAKASSLNLEINALQCDMKEIHEKLEQRFDLIFCIGNSIVHLGSLQEITDVLKALNTLLYKDGTLILQIINYDRIIKYGIDELPVIENPKIGVKFIRKYHYKESTGFIDFNTILTVEKGDSKEVYENSVKLLPLESQDMSRALIQAGFQKFDFYGDFNYTPYHLDSYMLVVKAAKQ